MAAWLVERVLPFLVNRTDDEAEDSGKFEPLAERITEVSSPLSALTDLMSLFVPLQPLTTWLNLRQSSLNPSYYYIIQKAKTGGQHSLYKLIRRLPSVRDKGNTNRFSLTLYFNQNFLSVCRDVVLVGLADETFKGQILDMCSLILHSGECVSHT